MGKRHRWNHSPHFCGSRCFLRMGKLRLSNWKGAPNPFLTAPGIEEAPPSQVPSYRVSPRLSHPHHTGGSHTGRID